MNFKKTIVLLFLICLKSLGQANFPTIGISSTRGCVPLSLTLSGGNFLNITAPPPTSLSGCVNFYYNINNTSNQNSNSQGVLITTLTAPGIYTITGGASCDGSNKFLSGTNIIEVLPRPTPNYNLFGCSSLTGRVQITDSQYDFYTISWGDGQFTNNVLGTNTYSHLYSSHGLKSITVTGTYNYTVNGLAQSCTSNPEVKSVVVYPALQNPDINYIEIVENSTSNGKIGLQLVLDNRFKYRVQSKFMPGGTYANIELLSSISGIYNRTYSGLNTSQVIQMRVFPFDDCNTTVAGVEVGSIVLNAFATTPAGINSRNAISWNNNSGTTNVSNTNLSDYNLSVNGVQINSQQRNTNFSGQLFQMQYSDNQVICNQNYCYKVIGTAVNAPNTKSISATQCVLGQKSSSVTGVNNLNSSFIDEKLQLFWTVNSTISGVTYLIQGKNGSTTQFISNTLDTIYRNAPQQYECYSIISKESCGDNVGIEKTTCPIRLKGQKVDSPNTQNSFSWNTYINGDNIAIASTEIEWYSDKQIFISKDNAAGLTYLHNTIDENNQNVRYRIKVTLSNGTVVYSDNQDIISDVRLYVPTAFTPNGDSKNQTFFPKGLFWKDYLMKIYNRWGETQFSSTTPYEGWDGGNASPGLYSFSIRVEDFFGNVLTKNGTLRLDR